MSLHIFLVDLDVRPCPRTSCSISKTAFAIRMPIKLYLEKKACFKPFKTPVGQFCAISRHVFCESCFTIPHRSRWLDFCCLGKASTLKNLFRFAFFWLKTVFNEAPLKICNRCFDFDVHRDWHIEFSAAIREAETPNCFHENQKRKISPRRSRSVWSVVLFQFLNRTQWDWCPRGFRSFRQSTVNRHQDFGGWKTNATHVDWLG